MIKDSSSVQYYISQSFFFNFFTKIFLLYYFYCTFSLLCRKTVYLNESRAQRERVGAASTKDCLLNTISINAFQRIDLSW